MDRTRNIYSILSLFNFITYAFISQEKKPCLHVLSVASPGVWLYLV